MKSTDDPWVIFPFFGFASGIASGMSVLVPGLGLIAPGVLLGIALMCGFEGSGTRLSWGQRMALVIGTTIGYIAAMLTGIVIYRAHDLGNGFHAAMVHAGFAGGAGGLIVSATLALAVPSLAAFRVISIVTVAGGLFGVPFGYLAVYIADHTAAGHPWDDFVAFTIWQVGVAGAVPLACGPFHSIRR
ncbi:hypothetical protein [Blastopirellula marina]|nr:hypothetical protein [Blastopirellula marina]